MGSDVVRGTKHTFAASLCCGGGIGGNRKNIISIRVCVSCLTRVSRRRRAILPIVCYSSESLPFIPAKSMYFRRPFQTTLLVVEVGGSKKLGSRVGSSLSEEKQPSSQQATAFQQVTGQKRISIICDMNKSGWKLILNFSL